MKRAFVTLIAVCAVAVAGMVVFKTLHAASNSPAPTPAPAAQLPPAYKKLQIGMSESDVVAAIGKPEAREVNPRYVYKSAAEWAALHRQEDAASNDSNLAGAPSPTEIRIGGILAHQVKENWRYEPKGTNAYAALAFDGTGHLLNWGSGVRPMSR